MVLAQRETSWHTTGGVPIRAGSLFLRMTSFVTIHPRRPWGLARGICRRLTRNEGIITSAHSTQNLPQVVLEVEGDDIYAVGVKGLIYGMPDNLMKVS